MTKVRGIITGTILAGLILALMIIMGCSDLPTVPEQDGIFTLADFESIAARQAEFSEPEDGGGSVLIPADEGGVIPIVFSNGSEGSLEVPPNAIRSDTEISVEVTEVILRDRAILQFDFQPDGLRFSTEATLTIDASAFRDADMEYVDWYYYNPDSGKWELVDRYPLSGDKVYIKMSHFSKWMSISQGGQ
ncbi:MAG TPA: hypothetical protein ENO22_10015 [candidate division Zixibacteria bacterium]|nr:hypothetical protein [candidate division Zixibacteria bacterium]